MSKWDAVIFDWAGTTVDFGSFAPVQAFVEVFKEYGIEPTMEEVREPMGMLKIDHIRTMLNMPRIKECWVEKYQKEPADEDAQKLFSIFEEKLLSILHLYAEPKKETVAAVKKLREHGIKIGSTTGYTDKMMDIVVPLAKEKGYAPDVWFSPDSTNNVGRPYPYMIFENMKALNLMDVSKIIKAGDTVSDIKEGKNAGVFSVGIIVGGSEMGLTEEEYQALSKEEQAKKCAETAEKFKRAGADEVFLTLAELADFVIV